MKVCLVTTEFISEEGDFDGGLANYVYKIAKYLIKDRHKVVVVLQSDTDENFVYEDIPVFKVKVNLNNKIYKFIKRLTKLKESLDWLLSSYVLNNKLKKLQIQENFDLIHYSSFRGIGFFRLRNVPVLVRISSYHPYINEVMGVKPRSLEDRLMFFLESKAYKKADIVIGANEKINQKIEEITKRKVLLVEQLCDFVKDENLVIAEEFSFLRDKKYFLFIGKMNKCKGSNLIAEIIYELLNKYKDLYFVFAGKDAGYKNLIIENAKEYKDRLVFVGRLRKDQLNPIIKQAYAVVIPSKNDNFPNTAIEAMSLKRIVVGTYSSGFPQVIDNNVNGYLINDDSSIELMKALDSLLSLDKIQKESMEVEAFKSISRLNPENIVKATLNAYNSAIEDFKKTL